MDFAGINYLSVLSNGAPFGIKNLIVPDLGARFRYVVSEKADYYASLRLAPFDTSFKDLGYEIEFSRSYLFSNLHRGEFGLKYSDYGFHPNVDETVGIRLISIFLSYSL